MGELTTSIAHEVKQPLFAIVSNAQSARRLLDRTEPDIAEVHEALRDIASDANRASDIVDHIRSLVRKEPQRTEPLDLNEVVRRAVRLADPELASRGVSIRSELAGDLPRVRGNSIELQQVLLNLMINGAQSMRDNEPGSRDLKVATAMRAGLAELIVEDRGVGLDEEQSRRLFEPFYTTKREGMGMGLAISRTIVEAHSGRIWASANVDRGASFHVSLPLSDDPEDAT